MQGYFMVTVAGGNMTSLYPCNILEDLYAL